MLVTLEYYGMTMFREMYILWNLVVSSIPQSVLSLYLPVHNVASASIGGINMRWLYHEFL